MGLDGWLVSTDETVYLYTIHTVYEEKKMYKEYDYANEHKIIVQHN